MSVINESFTIPGRLFLRMDQKLIAQMINGDFGTNGLTWIPNHVGKIVFRVLKKPTNKYTVN